MQTPTYLARRGQLETYFDRTAAEAWERLTSNAPVSRIRATVRAGRDRMRATLLDWLPHDLTGARLLDAGCGTGALSVEAARRGASVVAIDLAGNLVEVARQRIAASGCRGIELKVGDMLDPALGTFDHVVAMDSLIHYPKPELVGMLAGLAARASHSVVFTFAPRTPALSAMHAVGRFFPRSDRAPAIEPISEMSLRDGIAHKAELAGWVAGRSERVVSGFYTSQAMELSRR